MVGAFASGAVIGGATEQVNIYSRTGHLATLGQTATGALSFGLTAAAFQGVGNVLSQRAGKLRRAVKSLRRQIASALPAGSYSLLPRKPGSKHSCRWPGLASGTGQRWQQSSPDRRRRCLWSPVPAGLKLETIGGVSGGFVPAALAATEMPSHQLLSVARDTDIAALLTKGQSINRS